MFGPIALYPDPLLAVLLPAATQPGEIVQATRFLNNGGADSEIEAQAWRESVKALAHYPDVVRWLDENLDWTTDVGNAFMYQPVQVMEAIQRLRRIAQSFGNLQTTPEQIVEADADGIDITPADPEIIYVPVYEPEVVYTRVAPSGWGPFVTFGPRLSVGAWFRNDWDWRGRRVVTWNKTQSRPPAWWSQKRAERFRSMEHFQEWCPRARRGPAQSKWWASRREALAANGGKTAVYKPATAPMPPVASTGTAVYRGGKHAASGSGGLRHASPPRTFSPGQGGAKGPAPKVP